MRRVALIVGVNRYDRDPSIRPLQFVDSDATELHGLLKHQCGYDQVRLLRDPSKREVLDGIEELSSQLDPSDLLLFYFAGHGVEIDSKHLLLCRPAKLSMLKHLDEVIPVDHLRDISARPGVERVFILDSCRSDLTWTRDGVGSGLRGEQSLRDVVASKSTTFDHEGPLTILCSCTEGHQALELPDRRQGLFTAALLDVMQDAIGRRCEIRLSDDFEDALANRMNKLASLTGQRWEQRPWVQRSGAIPILATGAVTAGSTPTQSPSGSAVAGGRRNRINMAAEAQSHDAQAMPHESERVLRKRESTYQFGIAALHTKQVGAKMSSGLNQVLAGFRRISSNVLLGGGATVALLLSGWGIRSCAQHDVEAHNNSVRQNDAELRSLADIVRNEKVSQIVVSLADYPKAALLSHGLSEDEVRVKEERVQRIISKSLGDAELSCKVILQREQRAAGVTGSSELRIRWRDPNPQGDFSAEKGVLTLRLLVGDSNQVRWSSDWVEATLFRKVVGDSIEESISGKKMVFW